MKKKRYKFKNAYKKAVRRNVVNGIITRLKHEICQLANEVPPIKEGDKLLVESIDINDASFGRNKATREYLIEEGYANAAGYLLYLIRLSRDNIIKDGCIFPALFCFRHHIELTMKNPIYRIKHHLSLQMDKKDWGFENTHELLPLFDILIQHLNEFAPNTDDKEIECVKNLIQELNQYHHTYFKYQFEFEDKKDPIDLNLISIDILEERVLQLYRFFEGINSLAHSLKPKQ